MNKIIFTEIYGWYGVLALLGAYMLLSFGFISANEPIYQILNISGAIGIVIEATAKKNWQPAVLNVIWVIVGCIALVKVFF